MNSGRFLVMRYGPLIGRPADSRRRVSVLTRDASALNALAYARGWLSVDRRHGDAPSMLWIAKAGAPATRARR